jgi:serine/threonine protein kinase
MVTEYLPGKDALDLLVSHKKLDEEMAFGIFYQCLLALNYLHRNKVMHRYRFIN